MAEITITMPFREMINIPNPEIIEQMKTWTDEQKAEYDKDLFLALSMTHYVGKYELL